MTIAQIKSGQFITLTGSEQAYELDGDARDLQEVLIILGATTSVQLTVSDSISPVINGTYSTYTEEGLKLLITLDTGRRTLRFLGSGTVNITW